MKKDSFDNKLLFLISSRPFRYINKRQRQISRHLNTNLKNLINSSSVYHIENFHPRINLSPYKELNFDIRSRSIKRLNQRSSHYLIQ